MPYTAAGKNIMLDRLGTQITAVSLHSADPGTTGASELTGGSPAYGRKTIAWNTAAAGVLDDSSNGVVFDIPAGTTVAYVGFWASTTFVASSSVTAESFNAQGTYTLTDAKLDLNA